MNMKRYIYLLTALLLALSVTAQSDKVKNPILPGFNPDPSICRVGDYFYICNSSFTWYPGLPISRSKDLVNWELVGHGINRPDMLVLDGVKDKDGVWAPTIRHHEGVWYIFCNVSNRGNFYITASDVEGPWSDPVFIEAMPGIDPSIFWEEDGRSYIIGNHGKFPGRRYSASTAIWIQEIDLKKGKLVGERHYIATGHAFNAKYAEGPHIYKINGKYVLLVAEGGTDFYHAQTVLTSDHLFGPYLAQNINPVLSQRQMGRDSPIQCVGHSDLVQTPDGQWYSVALGKRMLDNRYSFTRETFLCPVEIQDGEFVFNPGYGCMTSEIKRPDLPWSPVAKPIPEKENFEAGELERGWYYNRIPHSQFHTLSDGQLHFKLMPQTVDSLVCPALLMRKPASHFYCATTRLSFSTRKENECAGLILYRNSGAYIALLKGLNELQLVCQEKGVKQILQRILYNEKDVYLHLNVKGLDAVFKYGPSEDQMQESIGVSLLPLTDDNQQNRFNGLGIGMYASSNGKVSEAVADFDFFEYCNLPDASREVNTSISSAEMQQIYEEVKTPYKYGVVVEAPGEGEMVDCPSVFRVSDGWAMTYVLFNGRGYETWLAKSSDLLHWQTKGKVLAFGEGGWDKDQRGGFPALQDMQWGGSYRLGTFQGKHWMSYIGSSTPGYEGVPISIGLASTTRDVGEHHLWTTLPRPAMAWNDADTLWWESYSPYKSLIYEAENPLGSRFIMFYNASYQGKEHNSGERIGIAISDDLLHWKRYAGNPVFQHDYARTITGDAQIQRIGNVYVMFYFCAHHPQRPYGAYNSFAVSRDLLHWTDWGGEPLVKPSETYDARYAHKSFVVKWEGNVYHFYCAVDKNRRRCIALATSRRLQR